MINIFNYYNSIQNYVPLLLRANEPIEQIGKNYRTDERIYCFMGSSYGMNMVPTKYKGLYHRADINGFLDYETRKKIYLTSVFALGYHGEEPIVQKSISQRIFEGLAYGCIVLTNSQYAVEYTDNICIYVNSLQDVEREIEYYYNNTEKRKEKKEFGYEWMRKNIGTNRSAWKLFFDKIEELKYYQDYSLTQDKSCVYVKLCGGLGNQLFQIANGYAYSLRYNKNFYVSKTWPGINSERPSYWDSMLSSIQPYLKDISEFKGTLYKEPTWEYREIPYIEGDVIFEGYFQCDKYFEDYSEDIRKLFDIYPSVPKNSLEHKVAVHIRRGDYLKNPLFHTILQKDYYEKGKSIIQDKIIDPEYIYFSEDIKWVKETFKTDAVICGMSDIEEFQLMMNCNHFILANSSFSWWASWFAKSKLIVSPSQWFGPQFGGSWNSIYRKDFIII